MDIGQQINEHKRHKTGHLPGDISQGALIRILEQSQEFNVFPWQKINKKFIKAYRNDHYMKAKTKQRQRDKTIIKKELQK